MSLEWLAAVLQPHDVAPHPNFSDDKHELRPAARLAAAVEGTAWRYQRREPDGSVQPAPDEWQDLAEACFDAERIAEGAAGLAYKLLESPPRDKAQSVALTLVACSALAERDDYDLCFRLLESQGGRLKGRDVETSILRAAVLQQEALRRCDVGAEYVDTAAKAGQELIDFAARARRVSAFPTSPGVSWDYRRTMLQIGASLLEASVSLVPWERKDDLKRWGLPDRFDLVKEEPTDFDFRLSSKRGEVYSKHIAEEFRNEFQSNTRQIWATDTDLFHTLLLAELMGDARVYALRKEVAMLRLARGQAGNFEYADALRLLRQSGATEELDLVIRRLRFSGPLAPLSADARQILLKGSQPERLRSVEFKVLSAAAELLAPPEASQGLRLVAAVLANGAPPNLPMRWQIDALRTESAWVAAASLARSAELDEVGARLLLDEAHRYGLEDQIFARAMQRALTPIEWDRVSNGLRGEWSEFASGLSGEAESLRDSILIHLNEAPPADMDVADLSDAVRALNSVMLDLAGASQESLEESMPVVRKAMQNIREQAAGNSWSMPVFDAADVAAGLILFGRTAELVNELAEFLLDDRLQRLDKDAAFERLSRAADRLPSDLTEPFRGVGQRLLHATGRFGLFERQEISPWPSALRFLSAAGVLELEDVYDAVAELASSADWAGRVEAAKTVALLADRKPYSDLVGVALTLAGDRDVSVKAHAGRALVRFAAGDRASAQVARRRLRGLLQEDGILAPTLIVRALAEDSWVPDPLLTAQVRNLASNHPAKSVRGEARKALKGRDEDVLPT